MKIYYLFLLVLFYGCASSSYTPPPDINYRIANFSVVNKPFDVVWSGLIEHLASTYFGIENYEKSSGLMTLTFGSSDPSKFITGGVIKTESIAINYQGDYIDYLIQNFSTDFQAKMNIVVKAESENKTRVIVNTRYVLISKNVQTGEVKTWSFNTNSEDKQIVNISSDKSNAFRIVRPTHKAEKDILNAISKL